MGRSRRFGPEVNPMAAEGGAAPDLPPERPQHNPMQTRGGTAPHER
jgi:hypothetical protein